MDMIVAQCQRCQRNFYSFEGEDAVKKYKEHKCTMDFTQEELGEVLDRILKGDVNETRE